MYSISDATDISISSKTHIGDADMKTILKYILICVPIAVGFVLLIVVICQLCCICKIKRTIREQEEKRRLKNTRDECQTVYDSSGDELKISEKTPLSGSNGSSTKDVYHYKTIQLKPSVNWIPYQANVSVSRTSRRHASEGSTTSKDDSPKSRIRSLSSRSGKSILGSLPPLEEVHYLEIPKMAMVTSDECGHVLIGIEYNAQNRTLLLTVESAHELPVRTFGREKKFVAAQMWLNTSKNDHADEKYNISVETESQRFTANPIFNKTFEYYLEPHDVNHCCMYICIIIWEKYAPKRAIAEASLLLESVDLGEKCRALLALSPSTKNKTVGELLISLCYLPTSARFIVGIMKASDLKTSQSGSCDSCVRITCLIGGKRIRKRKTTTRTKQTNPEFHELFVFDVPREKIDKVKFLIMVSDERFTISSPDSETPENEIGRVLLGKYCSLEANVHWDEIQKQPRKPVAQWYSLY